MGVNLTSVGVGIVQLVATVLGLKLLINSVEHTCFSEWLLNALLKTISRTNGPLHGEHSCHLCQIKHSFWRIRLGIERIIYSVTALQSIFLSLHQVVFAFMIGVNDICDKSPILKTHTVFPCTGKGVHVTTSNIPNVQWIHWKREKRTSTSVSVLLINRLFLASQFGKALSALTLML